MLRVVLAAAVATAVLGVAMPVVDDARTDRSRDVVEGELTRLADRVTGLVATEETGPDPAARRVVSLSLPDGGLTTAPVDFLAVGGVPDCGSPRDAAYGDVLAYRLEGGETRVTTVPVDIRVVTDGRVRDDEDPLVVRGDAKLALRLVDSGGEPTVLVGRGVAVDVADVDDYPGDDGA